MRSNKIMARRKSGARILLGKFPSLAHSATPCSGGWRHQRPWRTARAARRPSFC
jgi:hypothetical protein